MFTRTSNRLNRFLASDYSSSLHLNVLKFIAEQRADGKIVTRTALASALSKYPEYWERVNSLSNSLQLESLASAKYRRQKTMPISNASTTLINDRLFKRAAGKKIVNSLIEDLGPHFLAE